MNEFTVGEYALIDNEDSLYHNMKGLVTEVIFSQDKGYLYRLVIEGTCMVTVESERVLVHA